MRRDARDAMGLPVPSGRLLERLQKYGLNEVRPNKVVVGRKVPKAKGQSDAGN